MLIRFKVGNYTSFDDIQVLSMTPGLTEGHPEHLRNAGGTPVLRIAAVYGANASGKSNLIKALRDMKGLVIRDEKIPSDRYFRPGKDNAERPSFFETEIGIGSSIYSYGFEYVISKHEVVDEWLYRLSLDGENRILFQRNGTHMDHTFEGSDGQRMDIYAEDTAERTDRLFINVMGERSRPAEGELGVFNDVYDWFRNGLRFIDTDYPFMPEVLVTDRDFERLNDIISTFGTGINSIGYVRKEGMDEVLPQRLIDDLRKSLTTGNGPGNMSIDSNRYASVNDYRASMDGDRVVFDEIVYRHNDNRVVYRPDEESDGTRKLYGLLASTFIDDRTTYIVDGLDSGLHPQLTFRFIGMFLGGPYSGDSQMVFTTHESSLMDFRLLRRDEIWFTDKDAEGRSSLYSLEDFNERSDRRIEKAYREGRYGGVPVFCD